MIFSHFCEVIMKAYSISCKNDPFICKSGIVFEENYSLVIMFEIMLAQNFISNKKMHIIHIIVF